MANLIKNTREQPAVRSGDTPFLQPTLIDRFFDDSFFDPLSLLTPSVLSGRRAALGNFPKVDVSETSNEIKVTANVPGIDPNQIDIEVGDDYLSLSGKIEREHTENDEKEKIYRYEREYGEFRREFSLPARVNKEGIVAKAKNGVLTITLPKSEDEHRTKIKIDTE